MQHVLKFNKILAEAKAKWPKAPEDKWPKEFPAQMLDGYLPQVEGDCDDVADATTELLAVIQDLPEDAEPSKAAEVVEVAAATAPAEGSSAPPQ